MRHCCQFKPDAVYFLHETALYTTRKLSVGICPICQKPVAELFMVGFSGAIERKYYYGITASDIVMKLKDEIDYSSDDLNRQKFKSKPYGWKYGINKAVKVKGKQYVRQYACDFYGNKEIIKTI